MSNFFQDERLKYQPRLPRLLQQFGSLDPAPVERRTAPLSIQSILPKTSSQPLIHFRAHAPKKIAALRVGVLLSGGQAPGGHNVITGLFDALKKINQNCRLFGFLGGPLGILENRYQELSEGLIAPYRNTGGFDLIGSGRTKIETEEQFATALKNCAKLNLNGLVIIGGDDSNTNAALIAEYFLNEGSHTYVVGVPKTIDGDLKNQQVETSFGFDTACKIYSEMIGNICRDALSAKKYYHFIKLMGRSASHIALECALQTHPTVTLISEEVTAKKMTLHHITDMLCEVIAKRAEEGHHYGVVLIPEGVIEFVPEMKALFKELNAQSTSEGKLSKEGEATFSLLPETMRHQLMLERDPHGNIQVSHIATEQLLIHLVKQQLASWPAYQGKFTPVGHFLGYEGRCGYPSNFDANYCYALGHTAALLVADGFTGYMCCVQNLTRPTAEWQIGGIPITMLMNIEQRKGKSKPVIQKALVDLNGKAFLHLQKDRDKWATEDDYQFTGPMQFFGEAALCDLIPKVMTLL